LKYGLNAAIMLAMTTDKVTALKRTALFQELDDQTLRLLAEHAVPRHYRKDEVLFLAGEKAHGLFVIVSGSVRAFRESEGREQVIHVERAGATVAEVPVFDDGTYPSTVAAEEDTDTLFLFKQDVRRLSLQHPEIPLAAVALSWLRPFRSRKSDKESHDFLCWRRDDMVNPQATEFASP
jgi:CRP-like cAMP-binding protein